MKIVGFIPARMGSSRFPGKPIENILGHPMIEHIYRRTAMCPLIDETYIATCDEEIVKVTEAFGGKAVMTSDRHERASDRIAEAIETIECDIAVMVQGDEPMTHPDMITRAVQPMIDDASVDCINLTKKITSIDEFEDPNCIKVLLDQKNNALAFSRQPIPHLGVQTFDDIRAFKQVCIIPFRRAALERYYGLAPTPLEIAESVDMMRFLEHGMTVRMIETDAESFAVDTPADLTRVENIMREDAFTSSLLKEWST